MIITYAMDYHNYYKNNIRSTALIIIFVTIVDERLEDNVINKIILATISYFILLS
jgi:hypothetical protein